MRLPDVAGSYVLLVGTSRYSDPDLADLPSVERNLTAMRELLTRPDIGGLDPLHCVTVENPKAPADVTELLLSMAEQVEDCLVLYFAGHGLVHDHDDDLHLAMAGTSVRNVWSSTLRYADVRQILGDRLPDRKVVVILDCCFAGRAIPRMSGSGTHFNSEISGAYVLTATARDATALAPAGSEFTAFTGILAEILSGGVAGEPELLSLEVVYEQLRLRLGRKGHPQPRRDNLLTGPVALARNAYRSLPLPAAELTAPAAAGRQRAADGPAVPGLRFLKDLPLVKGGYQVDTAVAGIDDLLERMADPEQCLGLLPPFFPRGRRKAGYPVERVNEFILSCRPAPADFPGALRLVLADWRMLLTARHAASREVAGALSAVLVPAGEQTLGVLQLRSSLSRSSRDWLVITDRAVRFRVSGRQIGTSHDRLGDLRLTMQYKDEAWGAGDTGGVTTLSSLVIDYGRAHAKTVFTNPFTNADRLCITLVDAIRGARASFPPAGR